MCLPRRTFLIVKLVFDRAHFTHDGLWADDGSFRHSFVRHPDVLDHHQLLLRPPHHDVILWPTLEHIHSAQFAYFIDRIEVPIVRANSVALVYVAYVRASPTWLMPLTLHLMVFVRQAAIRCRMTDPDFSSTIQCCRLRNLLIDWWLDFIWDRQSLSLLLEDSRRRTFVIVCSQFLFFALSFMQLLDLIKVFNFDPLEVIIHLAVLVLHHEHLKLVIDLDSLEGLTFWFLQTVRWLPRCLSWLIPRFDLDLVGIDRESCSIVESSARIVGVRLITTLRRHDSWASPSISISSRFGFNDLHRIYMTVGRVSSGRASLVGVAHSCR